MKAFLFLQILVLIMAIAMDARASRIKDIANVRGVRTNQLVGYGIVVGLAGTGDSKLEYTNKSVERMLDRLGMKLDSKGAAAKNVAAVILTAELPAFARSGNKIDVTVNALGDATSLKGGTLVQSPLRAADQQIYAVAQGSMIVGFAQGGVHETVARIPNGAMIERDVGQDFSARKMFRITLHNPDFTTSARMSQTINRHLAGKYASAKDAVTIDLMVPPAFEGKGVELLSVIESLEVNPDTVAKVVVNEKTGTVVIGHGVQISKVAISHGDLTVKVGDGAKGKKGDGESLMMIDHATSVGDLVKAMNLMGVTPKDLITILQSIKAAGALQGELEIL
ncbi:MAG: flagellar basal body P-ring protein FlgI [Bdellovibrionales bacterium]|nr:flagellar basal body P-ring protein FlgI [Bdellovibrionales bacterium]